MEEIEKHGREDDCWLTLDGNVYDITEFIPDHPSREIITQCGKDAKERFVRQGHGEHHRGYIQRLKIGELRGF